MKIIISALFFTLVNFIGVFAQVNQTSLCPTISVTGPSSVSKPGNLVAYSATVSKNVGNYTLKYVWTISSGKILKGQGTSAIQLNFDFNESRLLATVKIEGLPEHCENSASEIMYIDTVPEAEKLDEVSLAGFKLNKDKNDKLIDVLKNDPTTQLYVIFYFKKNSSQKSIERKIQQIEKYLVNTNKIDKERITKVKAFTEKREFAEFWLLPSGVMPPTPEK